MQLPNQYAAILEAVMAQHSDVLERPLYKLSEGAEQNAIRLALSDGAHRIFTAFHEAMMEASGTTIEVRAPEVEEAIEVPGVMAADQYLLNNVQQTPDPQAPEGPSSS